MLMPSASIVGVLFLYVLSYEQQPSAHSNGQMPSCSESPETCRSQDLRAWRFQAWRRALTDSAESTEPASELDSINKVDTSLGPPGFKHDEAQLRTWGGNCLFESAPEGSISWHDLCDGPCISETFDFLNNTCLLQESVHLGEELWAEQQSLNNARVDTAEGMDEIWPECSSAESDARGAPDVERLRRLVIRSFGLDDLKHTALSLTHRDEQKDWGGVVIVGDSMLRQFFNSIVHIMRSSKLVTDYNHHTHALYTICDAEDRLSFPCFDKSWDYSALLDCMSKALQPPKQSCRRRFLVAYIHAPSFGYSETALINLLKSDTRSSLTVISSVGFWEHNSTNPDTYMDALEKIQNSAKQLVLMTTPTELVHANVHKQSIKNRNVELRDFVQRSRHTRGQMAWILDFELISDANSFSNVRNGNWHYQAFLKHQDIRPQGHVMEKRCWEHPSPVCKDFRWWWREDLRIANFQRTIIDGIATLSDGSLTDNMNRLVWESLACKHFTVNPESGTG